jgi:hypothetical protein
VARNFKHGNEPSVSIKYGRFIEHLSAIYVSQEGLRSMELINQAHVHKLKISVRSS